MCIIQVRQTSTRTDPSTHGLIRHFPWARRNFGWFVVELEAKHGLYHPYICSSIAHCRQWFRRQRRLDLFLEDDRLLPARSDSARSPTEDPPQRSHTILGATVGLVRKIRTDVPIIHKTAAAAAAGTCDVGNQRDDNIQHRLSLDLVGTGRRPGEFGLLVINRRRR